MSIEQSPEEYVKNLPDWKRLLRPPSTNPRFTPSDMDGFVERNGRFLWLEWKRTGVVIDFSRGQGLSLMRLATVSRCSVLVLWGKPPNGPVTHIQRLGKDNYPTECIQGTEHQIAYDAWYEWADEQLCSTS